MAYNLGSIGSSFGTYIMGAVTNPPIWNNIIDAQGALRVNGMLQTGSLGEPSGTMTSVTALGNDSYGFGFNGYVKYLLISTNHAITGAEATDYGCVHDQRSHQRERRLRGMVEI